MTVQSVFPRGAGRHTLYRFIGRRCRPGAVLASYDLRHPEQRFRRSKATTEGLTTNLSN